jgi:hypothetical protein
LVAVCTAKAVIQTASEGNTVRNIFRILLGSVFLVGTLSAGQVLADDRKVEEETTTTTTTTQQGGMATQQQGTVTQISPSSIVIRPLNAPNPVTYTSSTNTVYVDEAGNPVAIESVQSGAPVVVYYDKAGTKTTATKVVVKKKTEIEE